MKSPVDDYMDSVNRALGWRVLFERRALREVRDHLEDLALSTRKTDRDSDSRQRLATHLFGSVEHTVEIIVESNRGLAMMKWLSARSSWVASVLLLPAVALLGLSFLTFNVPCRPGPQAGFDVCGLSFLQGLRPVLTGPESNLLLMTLKFALTVIAPMAAVLIFLVTQARWNVNRETEVSVAVVLRVDRSRVLGALGSLVVLILVVGYQLAG